MIYPGFLGLVISPSNSGKTHYVLDEIAASPPVTWRKRVYIYTFSQDPQFGEIAGPVEVKSYDALDVDAIPEHTLVILDELNDALHRHTNLLPKLVNLFTTRVHHGNLSGCVGILQTVLKSPAFALLRLCHAVTLQGQMGSNAELLKHLPLYKTVTRQVEQFLLHHQERPYWFTIYVNPPFAMSALASVIQVRPHPQVQLFFTMNTAKSAVTLRADLEASVLPFLGEKGGLAVVPLNSVETRSAAAVEPDASDAANRPHVLADNNVTLMIRHTVGPSRSKQFNALWYFVRNISQFHLDPSTLLLTYKKYSIGLNPFLSLLLRPTHLTDRSESGRRKSKSQLPPAAVPMTAVLLDNPSFNPGAILNTQLKRAALKFLLSSKGTKKGQKRKREDEDEEEEKRKKKRKKEDEKNKKKRKKEDEKNKKKKKKRKTSK